MATDADIRNASPFPRCPNMPGFQSVLYGVNPVVLLLSPLILIAVRGSKLTWLMAASIVSYLLIIRYPILAIPYTYATYFEILYTPVRNVVFFVHMTAKRRQVIETTGVRQQVQDENAVVRIGVVQVVHEVAADETCSTGDKNRARIFRSGHIWGWLRPRR